MGAREKILSIVTFGELSIRLDERKLSGFASRKAEALLVYLAVTGQAVPRSALAALFWEEASEKRAFTNLRVALSSLRKQLAPFLKIDRHSARLRASRQTRLDTLELERHLAEDDLEAGLALYQGNFLEGFHLRNARAFEDWQSVTREHYLLHIQESLHEEVRQMTARQALKTALRYTRKLLELDPYDEVALRRLLELLARTGQRNQAVQQYERFEKIYTQELGVAPDPATWELIERIRQGAIQPEPSIRLDSKGHLSEAQLHKGSSIPMSLTPFIGRESELNRLEAWLSDPEIRLVSLLGPGGSGKTRLSQEFGRRFHAGYEDGVLFVPLISITQPDELVSAVAATAGFHPEDDTQPEVQLLNYLASRNMLLILDNFETILEGRAFVSEILQNAPRVKILTTTREKLNLLGEHVFRIEGLSFARETDPPGGDWQDSALLFLQTARRLNPALAANDQVHAEIARICRLVEGMPLATELAASWADTLSLAEIGDRISEGLDILSVELEDLPSRHLSIRLVFDSTFLSLGSSAQTCFTALSVFRGSFDRRAAKAIAGATIQDLKTLVRKSLLSLQENGRYQLHELLRQYASERLAESPEGEAVVKTRHSHYYRDFLTRMEEQIIGGRIAGQEKKRITQELRNMRAGFRRAVEAPDLETVQSYLPGLSVLTTRTHKIEFFGRAIDALRSPSPNTEERIVISRLLNIVGVCEFHMRSISEGRSKIRASHALLQEAGPTAEAALAETHLIAANLGAFGFDYDYGPLVTAALDISRGRYQVRQALVYAGVYARATGDMEQSERHFNELLQLAESKHERKWLAAANLGFGLNAIAMEQCPEAIDFMQKCAVLYAETEDWQMANVAHKHLGILYLVARQYDIARHHFQQCLALFDKTGVKWRRVEALMGLGETMLAMGSIHDAEPFFHGALKYYQESKDLRIGVYLFAEMGELALAKGEISDAVNWFLFTLNEAPWEERPFINPIPGTMVRAIPLLEALEQSDLAGRIAAAIITGSRNIQLNDMRFAWDWMEKIKTEAGRAAHNALLEQAAGIQMESLLPEFEAVLQEAAETLPRSAPHPDRGG